MGVRTPLLHAINHEFVSAGAGMVTQDGCSRPVLFCILPRFGMDIARPDYCALNNRRLSLMLG